jgi:hypothetical protein
MNTISALTKHYKDPTYDRVNNPALRPVSELLPIAVTWIYDGQLQRIDFETSGAACALSDRTGVAIVDGLYESEIHNRAYVANADGSIRYAVPKPTHCTPSDNFSDVYYVEDVLNFFVSGPTGDWRIEYDANGGSVFQVVESR